MDIDDQTPENVLEDLTNVESNFFKEGYESGQTHGKLHGLFEGRALGQEKAFELWEEVGFYEGWAGFWVDQLSLSTVGVVKSGKSREGKAFGHAKQLLNLIVSFPVVNPTPVGDIDTNGVISSVEVSHFDIRSSNDDTAPIPEIDLSNLLSSIRARYRLLCASLNLRPRLVASSPNDLMGGQQEGQVEGVEGPMKGVDTRQLRF